MSIESRRARDCIESIMSCIGSRQVRLHKEFSGDPARVRPGTAYRVLGSFKMSCGVVQEPLKHLVVLVCCAKFKPGSTGATHFLYTKLDIFAVADTLTDTGGYSDCINVGHSSAINCLSTEMLLSK